MQSMSLYLQNLKTPWLIHRFQYPIMGNIFQEMDPESFLHSLGQCSLNMLYGIIDFILIFNSWFIGITVNHAIISSRTGLSDAAEWNSTPDKHLKGLTVDYF